MKRQCLVRAVLAALAELMCEEKVSHASGARSLAPTDAAGPAARAAGGAHGRGAGLTPQVRGARPVPGASLPLRPDPAFSAGGPLPACALLPPGPLPHPPPRRCPCLAPWSGALAARAWDGAPAPPTADRRGAEVARAVAGWCGWTCGTCRRPATCRACSWATTPTSTTGGLSARRCYGGGSGGLPFSMLNGLTPWCLLPQVHVG